MARRPRNMVVRAPNPAKGDQFIHTFYSGFALVAAQKQYEVFGKDQSQVGLEFTNMRDNGKLPKGWKMKVYTMALKAYFKSTTGVAGALVQELTAIVANSLYTVGFDGRDSYGEFPGCQFLGALSFGAQEATATVVHSGNSYPNGIISLPVPFELTEQFGFKSKFETFQMPSAAIVTAGGCIKMLYSGIAQRA